MSIFNWIKTNVSTAVSDGIQQGVAEGLAAVTSGEVIAVDADFTRIEEKSKTVTSAKSKTKRQR